MDKKIIGKFIQRVCAVLVICGCGTFIGVTTAFAYPSTYTFTLDKYQSPYMGSDWEISALRLYQATDDIIASGSICDTSACMTLIRSGKLLFEYTLFNLGMVIQHEYFGHGARAREFQLHHLNYHINFFSGATQYPLYDYSILNVNQKAALAAGGVEATSILAKELEHSFLTENAIDSRAATMYLVNSLDSAVYAFGAFGNAFHPDNDAAAYMENVNTWFTVNALTTHKFKLAMAWNWLNPMLYISGYSLIRYIWEGLNTCYFTNSLHIGSASFMPTTRTLLAPYGPEYQLLLNLFTCDQKFLGIYLRYGNLRGKTSWGIDIDVRPLAVYECWYIENIISAWHQPHLLNNVLAPQNVNKYGFADCLSVYYRLGHGIYAKGELGAKLSGYWPGRQLARGIFWGIGIRIDLDVKGRFVT